MCNDAGGYESRQCEGSRCFCVNIEGEEVLEAEGGIGELLFYTN